MKLSPLTWTLGALLFASPGFAQVAPAETVIGPDYADAPELAVNPAQPKGVLHAFVMRSEESKFYPGIRQLQNDVTARRDAYGNRIAAPADQQSEPAPYRREVFVYVPAGYKPGTELPFMVVQDGAGYAARVALALDSLIAQHRVPAMAAILIQSGGGGAQGSERGLEYDTLSGRYAEFIESEVLPRVERNYHLKLTRDPRGRAAMGGSSGAAAAFTMAWFHPELYSRVLSYSGTFVNQQSPPDPATPKGAWDYPHLDGGRREGQSLRRSRRDLSQLATRQPAHGGRAKGQGICLSLCVRARRRACRSARGGADIARSDRMVVGGL